MTLPTSLLGFTLSKNIYFSEFPDLFGTGLCIYFLRSALARRPACTLRMYTLLHMLAPCLASALSRYHPGWGPTPREPHPQGPPPRDPPTPPQPPVSPSGRLFRVDGYSKWMAFPSAWLFRGVLLQLNTRTCSDSVNAESIDCFGGVIVPSVQSQRGAACKDLTQEHPKSSPGAPRSTPRASSST